MCCILERTVQYTYTLISPFVIAHYNIPYGTYTYITVCCTLEHTEQYAYITVFNCPLKHTVQYTYITAHRERFSPPRGVSGAVERTKLQGPHKARIGVIN